MKKLPEKQGEKLPWDSDPSMMRWRGRGVASWEEAEDANNGKLSFRTLEDEMTLFELYVPCVDSTLQHEPAR